MPIAHPHHRARLHQLHIHALLLFPLHHPLLPHRVPPLQHALVVLIEHLQPAVEDEPYHAFGQFHLLASIVVAADAKHADRFYDGPVQGVEQLIGVHEGLNELLHLVPVVE